MKTIFLDNNSTTQPLPEVIEDMSSSMSNHWANPSSESQSASNAREHLEEARSAVADLVGAFPENVVFTSGGTEANNLIIYAALKRCSRKKKKLITSQIEHASIDSLIPKLEEQGVSVVTVKPDATGQVTVDGVLSHIDEETSVVSIQWANNETGVVQPVKEIGEQCHQLGVFFHSDASQFAGKGAISFSNSFIDALTLTAHKFHGPKGVGAAVLKEHPQSSIIFSGGGQEMGIRPGTENIPGIVGFGTAAKLRLKRLGAVCAHMELLRDQFERQIQEALPDVQINGGGARRVPNTSNILFPGVEGAILVDKLDRVGIECSQTSACTQSRPEPSHVLTAMGLSEEGAYSSIRFSFSELNRAEEVSVAVGEIRKAYKELKEITLELVG